MAPIGFRRFANPWWERRRRWLRSLVQRQFLQNPYVSAIITGAVGGVIAGVISTLLVTRFWPTTTPRPPVEIEQLIQAEADLALRNSRTADARDKYTDLFDEYAWIKEGHPDEITWAGRARIAERFNRLPHFETLQHQLDGAVEVYNDRTAAKARTITTFRLAGNAQAFNSTESWIFIRVNGEWKIRVFDCNPPRPSR